MLVHPWSIALLICSITTLLLVAGTLGTGFRILKYWDPSDDSSRQIRLETETWLSALLIEYGMVLQILSLLILVLAADNFSHILVGAMCATGAFLANAFGIPALLVKLFGLFLCGFWIVIHRLDISSEYSPLMRTKYYYLFAMAPVFLLDMTIVTNYLARLEPDIITSCCGIVFGSATGDGKNLVGPMPVRFLMLLFYGLAGILFATSLFFLKHIEKEPGIKEKIANILFSFLWFCFFLLSLLVITSVISSYIYAMPSHRCPFDILKKEYGYIGYPMYFLLITATFSGGSTGIVAQFGELPGLKKGMTTFRKWALYLVLLSLPLFLLFASWSPAFYFLFDGER